MYSHWVDSPQDQSETSDGTVEGLRLAILLGHSFSATNGKLVDNNEVGNAAPGVPAPLGGIVTLAESSEETSQDHNDVCNDCHHDVGSTETSKQGKIEKQKWSGNAPVNISCPIDLTEDLLVGIWDLLVLFSVGVRGVADTITNSHGEVGQEGESCDAASDDVEETFLLYLLDRVHMISQA